MDSFSGKKVLITGSTDGLGKLIARHFIEKDAAVILHGRNEKKGEAVLNEFNGAGGKNRISYYNGDYSSLEEVNSLSRKILNDHRNIDILINNVGIGKGLRMSNTREFSRDGYELRFAVNYLAHVLLTEKLLPLLEPKCSRIINIASIGQEPIDFTDLMLKNDYDGYFAYKQSKTALIMYTFDLAERLKEKSIKVNAIHPASLMNTKIVMEDWGYAITTVEQGAEAVESILSSETTGSYFDTKHLSKSIPQTYDREARSMLRNKTREMLKKYLDFNVER